MRTRSPKWVSCRIPGDRRGASSLEYAVLAVAVVVAVGAGVATLSDPTNGAFATAGATLTDGIANLVSGAAR